MSMVRNKEDETFERRGGYASPSIPRSQMKPPPASASASRPKPSQSDPSAGSKRK
ncbi:hypothetical protein VIMS_04130 [Mycobacterium marinum]|uniref:Uncharacterized protein n=1 Tax=Mycobacterium marinum TaxID=1781 RepID=A0A3E2MXP5_MYCMR|nr:hypothetical protein VIMS_04130 [Mycobacterium marinum]RFZ42942.1 hypothetical protein DAVIS_02034 [Mycobacterium marinum]